LGHGAARCLLWLHLFHSFACPIEVRMCCHMLQPMSACWVEVVLMEVRWPPCICQTASTRNITAHSSVHAASGCQHLLVSHQAAIAGVSQVTLMQQFSAAISWAFPVGCCRPQLQAYGGLTQHCHIRPTALPCAPLSAPAAIHRAAGPKLLAACQQVPEVAPDVRCPTGQARMTM
jgi:hypothetical protein